MDFTTTEAQRDLAGLTRDLVNKFCTNDSHRRIESSGDGIDRSLWSALRSGGLLTAIMPDAVAGDGFGLLEQVSILTELGRGIAEVPYATSVCVCAATIAEFGSPEQQRDWAVPAVAGSEILSFAVDEEFGDTNTRAVPHGSGWALTGTKILVEFAPLADGFLVPAATPEGTRVFLVRRGDVGVTVTAQQDVSASSVGIVEFDNVDLSADRLVDSPDAAQWALARATLAACAFQVGVLEQSLRITAAYATERVQFGKPIGSFQAVAQRLADAYIDVKGARLTLTQAAWQVSESIPSEAEIAIAKFWAADAGHRVAHTLVHIHGGVGLDRDHPAHRYFLAAKRGEFAHGAATEQLRRLGAILASVPA